MPRTWSVCSHPSLSEIDKALVTRPSYCAISRSFGLGRGALRRRAKEHLPERLKKASEHEDVREALDVVAQPKSINDASLAILEEARQLGKSESALKAINRIHRQIGLQLRKDQRCAMAVLGYPTACRGRRPRAAPSRKGHQRCLRCFFGSCF
jgi:hypothetical protein